MQHIETLVIGAGQAGLSTAHHLQQLGRDVLVVDGGERVGDNWRHRYDSLVLFTPAKGNSLDGLPFPGDPWHFPSKDEMGDYLELYAVTFELPVRLRARVEHLAADGDGRYVATLDGESLTCDNAVVATGTFGLTASVPAWAGELDPRIHQVHSADYRSPDELPDGPTLVVGASHSGLDIAHELGATRPTTLVGPERGAIPLVWGTRRMRMAFPLIEFAFTHVLTRRTPMGRKVMREIRHHGAPQLRVKRRDLEDRGVEWVAEHVTGVSPVGLPRLADGRTFDVASVVWATGYRQAYDWVDLPLEIDDGWPREYRGVVDALPGLFFCGLAFQYAFASGEVIGVGRDAAYVARKVVQRSGDRSTVGARR